MSTILIIVLSLNVVFIIGTLYVLGKRIQQLNYIKDNYRPYLRQNTKGFLEYSVDHNLWSPVVKFVEKATYLDKDGNTYSAPGLFFLTVTNENKDELAKEFCTIQKIWTNNSKALHKYHDALMIWLSQQNEKDI